MSLYPESVTFLIPDDIPTASYTIEFQGATIKHSNSTWCYKVSIFGEPGLNYWVLGAFELFQEYPDDKILLVTRNGIRLEKGSGYETGSFHGVSGIKFETRAQESESPVTYCITLKGVYEIIPVDIAVKGESVPFRKTDKSLCGPSCNIVEPQQTLTELLESVSFQETCLAQINNLAR
jgi:hypothetical protein